METAMNIYSFLAEHQIDYKRYDHQAVFTCDEVKQFADDLPGAKTKNLFLRDNKGKNHLLVVLGHDKRVDLKSLSEALAMTKLTFASSKRLEKYLGLTPGAVSILGLINDTSHGVRIVMDEAIWHAESFQCHPLVNTSTLVIAGDDLKRFLDATGHPVTVINIPEKT